MRLSGRYQLIEEIGKGGMGTVYRAHDDELRREVALKLLPEHLSRSDVFRQRFQQEVMLIARLEHAHIVPIYDVGEHEQQPFLVMRFLRGGSMSQRLKEGKITRQQLWKILREVAQALDTAHKQQVVHRDVKPSNILFDEHNSAFMSDFGIAKVIDAVSDLTGKGVIGSPAYMSPEHFTGQTIDGRSDQYSLAIVAYEALTGERPFPGETMQVLMYQHLHEQPQPLSDLTKAPSSGLDKVMRKALAKTPEQRYQSTVAFVSALEQAGTQKTSPHLANSPLPRTKQPARPTGGTTSRLQKIEVAYREGLTALEKKQWKTAVAAFDRVLALNPNHPKARARREKAARNARRSQRPTGKRRSARGGANKGVIVGAGGTQKTESKRPWWQYGVGIVGLIVAALFIARLVNATATPDDPAVKPETRVAQGIQATATLSAASTKAAQETVTPTPRATTSNQGAEDILACINVPNTNLYFSLDVSGICYRPSTKAGLRLILDRGALVAQTVNQHLAVENPFGAKVDLLADSGTVGVMIDGPTKILRVYCFRGPCELIGDISGKLTLKSGESGLVSGAGNPSDWMVMETDYTIFTQLAPDFVPTLTPTPTPTETPTPTRTPTPTPTRRVFNTSIPTAPTTQPDRDGDGVPDSVDNCPNDFGVSANKGCPQQDNPDPGPQPTWPPLPQPTSPPQPTPTEEI